jgi:hypothetical protein
MSELPASIAALMRHLISKDITRIDSIAEYEGMLVVIVVIYPGGKRDMVKDDCAEVAKLCDALIEEVTALPPGAIKVNGDVVASVITAKGTLDASIKENENVETVIIPSKKRVREEENGAKKAKEG